MPVLREAFVGADLPKKAFAFLIAGETVVLRSAPALSSEAICTWRRVKPVQGYDWRWQCHVEQARHSAIDRIPVFLLEESRPGTRSPRPVSRVARSFDRSWEDGIAWDR